MVAGIADAKAFAELAQDAASWLNTTPRAPWNSRMRRAAEILKEAGILVACLRALDNSLRQRLSAFALFDVDRDVEHWRSAVQEIVDFGYEMEIIPRLYDSVVFMKAVRDGEFKLPRKLSAEAVSRLYECGNTVLVKVEYAHEATSNRGYAACVPFDRVSDMWSLVKVARTDVDAARIRARSAQLLGSLVPPHALADAGAALSELRIAVLEHYPRLQDPSWLAAGGES